MTDATSQARYLEDVAVGEEFEEYQHPTSEHVAAFMGASTAGRPGGGAGGNMGDPGRGRFSDPDEARRQGLERPIVPGNMSTAMITRIVTDWMGPLGRIVSLDVSFRRPVLHGDRVRCVAVVTDAGDDALEGGGPAIVHLDVALENDRGERPVQGTAVVELPRRS
ncbi:MAG: MaoC family dehydratase [Dehalococcoidia bacterium]